MRVAKMEMNRHSHTCPICEITFSHCKKEDQFCKSGYVNCPNKNCTNQGKAKRIIQIRTRLVVKPVVIKPNFPAAPLPAKDQFDWADGEIYDSFSAHQLPQGRSRLFVGGKMGIVNRTGNLLGNSQTCVDRRYSAS